MARMQGLYRCLFMPPPSRFLLVQALISLLFIAATGCRMQAGPELAAEVPAIAVAVPSPEAAPEPEATAAASAAEAAEPQDTVPAPAAEPAGTHLPPLPGHKPEPSAVPIAASAVTGQPSLPAAIIRRGSLRVGVPFGGLYYMTDGPRESGLAVGYAAELQKFLRQRYPAASSLKTELMPMPRERLLTALEAGRIDLAMADLPQEELSEVTESGRLVLSAPVVSGVHDVIVTGPKAPEIGDVRTLDRLELHVRPSGRYRQHLAAMDVARKEYALPPLTIVTADASLEDRDLLELVGAGIFPATTMDSYKANLMAPLFDGLTVRNDLRVSGDRDIAWAMRAEDRELKAGVDAFLASAEHLTATDAKTLEAMMNPERFRSAMTEAEQARFDKVMPLIRKHAEKEGLDPLLIAALAYQESGFDQSRTGPAGAIGIMQVMAATAAEPSIGINDISTAEPNIRAGIKYLAHIRDQYFDAASITPENRLLFALAAYNTGPGNIIKARKMAEEMGLDPNVWFGNVEAVTAKIFGRTTAYHVRNVIKFFICYREAEKAGANR
jgi:membrane-bound lytic murein transglycosylase MltF